MHYLERVKFQNRYRPVGYILIVLDQLNAVYGISTWTSGKFWKWAPEVENFVPEILEKYFAVPNDAPYRIRLMPQA